MDDDHTVLLPTAPPLFIRILRGSAREREHTFSSSFRIGRSPNCEFQILDRATSKTHVQFTIEAGQWWIKDCGSKNGTLLNGEKIQNARLDEDATIELGRRGPQLQLILGCLPDSLKPIPPLPPPTRDSSISPLPVFGLAGTTPEADPGSQPEQAPRAETSSEKSDRTIPYLNTPVPPTSEDLPQTSIPLEIRHPEIDLPKPPPPTLNPDGIKPSSEETHISHVLAFLHGVGTPPPSAPPPETANKEVSKPFFTHHEPASPFTPHEPSQNTPSREAPLDQALRDLEGLTGRPSKTTDKDSSTDSSEYSDPNPIFPSVKDSVSLPANIVTSDSQGPAETLDTESSKDNQQTNPWKQPSSPPISSASLEFPSEPRHSQHQSTQPKEISPIEDDQPTRIASKAEVEQFASYPPKPDLGNSSASASLDTRPFSRALPSTEDQKLSPTPEPYISPPRYALSPGDRPDEPSSQDDSSLRQSPASLSDSVTQVIQHYFSKEPGREAGDQTILFRKAYERVHRQHSKKYFIAIGVVAFLLLLVSSLAIYQQNKLQELRLTAADLFYAMKNMELEVAQLEDMFIHAATPDQVKTILARRQKLDAMEKQYDRFLEELDVYSEGMSETDRIIFRMARLFGECEVALPDGFLQDVYAYIDKWRSTDRLVQALERAHRHGYPKKVSQAMLNNNMPPQFFYLALQESNFDHKAVGPKTRFGIAKGPWQFIPTTAVEYGLSTGPLVDIQQFDPLDDRHNVKKATEAAAKYIHFLYNTRAQASGLLVMASYNWGYSRVRGRIDKMPKNPRERNFWQLYSNFRIPKETKDYVFYIFSAAVIGQNPKAFGFAFENPLARDSAS